MPPAKPTAWRGPVAETFRAPRRNREETVDSANGKMTPSFKGISLAAPLLCLALAGCTERAAPPPGNPAVPVVVAKVARTSIPVELRAIGTGQAYKTVSIESQVAGIVQAVHYTQGQLVHSGDLLVTLDSRPFQAALQQAEANLARDKAQEGLDEVQAQRYQKLYQSGIVPQQQYDQAQATEAAAKATILADEAAIQTTKIQLSYCSIYATIDGVAGAQLVFPGTVVKANDLPVLVVVNQISPIYIAFSVPQQYLNEVKRYMAGSRLSVQASSPDQSFQESGYLSFVNNTVDPATGTIQLMATFANADRRLWPGQFANVVLRLAEQQNALVVPSAAVQTSQVGNFVFVVKPDMTADVRQVKTGRTVNGLTEITQGLTPGDTVVTDGQVRLVPGTKVYFAKGL
ncbi:MAG TPA: efflux RND transporter periplasmic adaptor subunit [Candidatus Acidoferrales bacterium]|nr:efflux RND transporter periplasmic adaptor subunit [Candidatus Acidoferrales bacterium]